MFCFVRRRQRLETISTTLEANLDSSHRSSTRSWWLVRRPCHKNSPAVDRSTHRLLLALAPCERTAPARRTTFPVLASPARCRPIPDEFTAGSGKLLVEKIETVRAWESKTTKRTWNCNTRNDTVKALNFGLHENFGLLFQKNSLYHQHTSYRHVKRNISLAKYLRFSNFILVIGFSFLGKTQSVHEIQRERDWRYHHVAVALVLICECSSSRVTTYDKRDGVPFKWLTILMTKKGHIVSFSCDE
jgi:hypothetical protein